MAAFLPQQEVSLDRQEVRQTLNRMFLSVSQEVEGHVTEEAAEEACLLMFTLYDRSGSIPADLLLKVLISLSAETLPLKYTALLDVVDNSGSVSRSGLRTLLKDLSLVPGGVQEDCSVFGSVEDALTSCFNRRSWCNDVSYAKGQEYLDFNWSVFDELEAGVKMKRSLGICLLFGSALIGL
ncbi:dystrotelin-like, partial [Etheostoma cragini]|uniref:dystrotelin-like n=1 Tax=Etheostoma cragini TaxID=417921 RepID=UPI00155E8459